MTPSTAREEPTVSMVVMATTSSTVAVSKTA
ncbi:hypothetical protein MAE30S32_47750 [Microcystis aeruginosa 11-30S32]|uniref:Uncharacterized protein n=1 Tax=Microcystis aeruginosa 11-30S32 TaxID=2358142 RepID=A0A510PRI8_MICAE|nr:hypothetical protein MAE30S32_47750 [Microcystis aeruginosa 11-30S32]